MATVTMPDPLMAELSTSLRSPEVFSELAQQASDLLVHGIHRSVRPLE